MKDFAKLLLSGVLLLMLTTHSTLSTSYFERCELKILVKYSTKADIYFEVANGVEPIRYFVFDEEGKTVSEDQSKIKDLKNGTYTYFIRDSRGCWSKGDFEIF